LTNDRGGDDEDDDTQSLSEFAVALERATRKAL
jgi:hypothetical protein